MRGLKNSRVVDGNSRMNRHYEEGLFLIQKTLLKSAEKCNRKEKQKWGRVGGGG